MSPESLAASGSTSQSWRAARQLAAYQSAILCLLWVVVWQWGLADSFAGYAVYFSAHGLWTLNCIRALLSRSWKIILGGVVIPTLLSGGVAVWQMLTESVGTVVGGVAVFKPDYTFAHEGVALLTVSLLLGGFLAGSGWTFGNDSPGEQGRERRIQFSLLSLFGLTSATAMYFVVLKCLPYPWQFILATLAAMPMLLGVAILPWQRRWDWRVGAGSAICGLFVLLLQQSDYWTGWERCVPVIALQLLPGFYFSFLGQQFLPPPRASRETSVPLSPFDAS